MKPARLLLAALPAALLLPGCAHQKTARRPTGPFEPFPTNTWQWRSEATEQIRRFEQIGGNRPLEAK